MDNEVVVVVATNKVGSESEVRTGISREEWDSMEEDQRDEIQNELMWNVLNVWIK